MAVITAPEKVALLRRSGQIAAAALAKVTSAVRPGISTAELNSLAETEIREAGGRPSFLGYEGYPASLCTSINNEVVHGIPSAGRRLKAGDIIGLDIGVDYQGLFSDHAVTVAVGKTSPDNQRLIDDTTEALRLGLAAVAPGATVGDIGAAVEGYLRPKHYGIVTQLTGHGLGYTVHEAPAIPNVGRPGTGQKLQVGMVLAIEPMVALGQPDVVTAADGWTVLTADGRPAAHMEHTIIVTPTGYDIITQP
ncbi:MAG: type I methionyl aminopeptidase [Candidatus Kerfeldbacteria bacterium]|nr:type I methionyl aminopeptidase [Candidatus Kerfeldbacteria bacterium]